jgi:hypothetical protein
MAQTGDVPGDLAVVSGDYDIGAFKVARAATGAAKMAAADIRTSKE